MPDKPNESLSNNHTIFVASSGGGKTQAMVQKIKQIKGKKRLICWDTHASFKGKKLKNIIELVEELIKNYDNDDFCICYQGKGGEQNFKKFTDMIWEFARGDKITHVVVDELADCTESIGKDRTGFGNLLRGGRKFGLVVYSTAVSVAEIPNTVWRESRTKYIGQQDNMSDIKRCADALIGVDQKDIKSLKPLEFLIKSSDNKVSKEVINYKKSPHKL